MTGRTRIALLSIGAAGLAWCSLPASAATPVAPEAGATTNSHPVFSWTLGPGEESDTVYVATRPDTTPEGRFHSENVVMTGGVVQSEATTWSPAEALFAGRYWWNVETRDVAFLPVYSATRDFTVATEVRLLSVRLSFSRIIRQVAADLRWVTNAHDVVVEVRFLSRRRTVGLVRRYAETLISRDPDRDSLSWRAPRRIRPGTPLVAVVRVAGSGQSATVRRTFRAP